MRKAQKNKRQPDSFQAHPRIRAFGRARIDIARQIQSQQDWDRLWKEPAYPFPFSFDAGWKHCLEYRVADFAAEVGFFIDILGLQVLAINADYAMVASPGGDFCLSIVSVQSPSSSTPPDAIRIQFMLEDLLAVVAELERRGIAFEQAPGPSEPGSVLHLATFRTPNGMPIDLWGDVDTLPSKNEPGFPQPFQEDLQGQDQLSERSPELEAASFKYWLQLDRNRGFHPAADRSAEQPGDRDTGQVDYFPQFPSAFEAGEPSSPQEPFEPVSPPAAADTSMVESMPEEQPPFKDRYTPDPVAEETAAGPVDEEYLPPEHSFSEETQPIVSSDTEAAEETMPEALPEALPEAKAQDLPEEFLTDEAITGADLFDEEPATDQASDEGWFEAAASGEEPPADEPTYVDLIYEDDFDDLSDDDLSDADGPEEELPF